MVSQWKEEANRCLDPNSFVVEEYYGNTRKKSTSIGWHIDILITTYGTLVSDFKNLETSPLYRSKWHRVVLDEAHLIKEKSTDSAKACYALNANNRWAVTGTPIINKLEYYILT